MKIKIGANKISKEYARLQLMCQKVNNESVKGISIDFYVYDRHLFLYFYRRV